jgi:beta-lactamase regulating signal transducer with metallopeptidase domain
MTNWLIDTTLESSFLICVVLLARPLIRRLFGAGVACALWLIPAFGVLLPARLPRPAMPIETLRLPRIPEEFMSAAYSWVAPGVLPWASLWLAGAALLLVAQLARLGRFRRKLQSTSEPFVTDSGPMLRLLGEFGVSPLRVFTTTLEGAPFVMGLFRAKVFLPADYRERFSAEEQRWIMVHELTHIRRGDLWLRLVAEAFRTLFWFNPLVHVALRALRQDQEYACDQAVVSRCTGRERYQYGKALLLSMGQRRLPAVPAFFGNGKGRFIMLGKHRKSRLNTVLGLSVCALIGGCALTSAPVSIAQQVEGSVSEGAERTGSSEGYRLILEDGVVRSLPEAHRLLLRDGVVRSLPEAHRLLLRDGVVRSLPEGGGLILLHGEPRSLPEGSKMLNGETRSLVEEGGIILLNGSSGKNGS